MSGFVSYVSGMSWVSGGSESNQTFYAVSDTVTGFPTQRLWLRGINYAYIEDGAGPGAPDAWISVWNGNDASVGEIYRFHTAMLAQDDSNVFLEDCYWNIDSGLYVKSEPGTTGGTKVIQNSSLTFYFSA